MLEPVGIVAAGDIQRRISSTSLGVYRPDNESRQRQAKRFLGLLCLLRDFAGKTALGLKIHSASVALLRRRLLHFNSR